MASSPSLRVLGRNRARRRLRIVAGLDGSDLDRRVMRWCESLIRVADVDIVPVHALEHEGPPHGVLARAAQEHDADLVVVGRRPRGALSEVLRPGMARRLGALVPCPVVVVPDAAEATEAPIPATPGRILVATDGGAAASAAVAWAAHLAVDLDAELVAVRVITAAAAPPSAATGAERRPRVVDEATAALEAELATIASRLPARHRSVVLVGDAAGMLLALAESEAPGLVVLGAAGRRFRPTAGTVAATLTGRGPCPVALVAACGPATDTGTRPFRRTEDMASETQRPRGVRFAAGTVVSPGEYRNCDTGKVRYFDGTTPLPGGVNSASWQQVSDHFHASPDPGGTREPRRDAGPHAVRFAAGTLVSPGEYRNCDTGAIRYFDGNTPLPGGINAASWQQVSDHHHPQVPERS
jgi:nucleotide-binding universal stress UspA family protein